MIVLKALRARDVLPTGNDGISEAELLVQALHHASIQVELESEKDLLAAGEFYKWWKQGTFNFACSGTASTAS